MATETRTRYRSSVSGKYVQKDTARRQPKTTVAEKDKVRTKKKDKVRSTKKKPKKPTVRTSSTARATTRRGRSTRSTRR